jgi:hypothetical protein
VERHVVRRMSVTRLRAPSGDGSVLCVPDWDTWPELVAANRRLQDSWKVDILGRSLGDLRRQARRDLLTAAIQYTTQYRDAPSLEIEQAIERPIVLGGHQPELFHPGVWLKNFALDELAQRVHGVAVNLVIDADGFKTNELPVPVRNGNHASRQMVPFDRAASPLVHEERGIVDPTVFASFGQRVAAELKPLVSNPWIREAWPNVVERAQATGLIGTAFAQVRHQIEGTLGLTTLELPQSLLCTQAVFHRFVAHLIAERHRFRDVYNQAIRDYRQAHHLRSASHPAPELRQTGDSLELPFWCWNRESGGRPVTFSLAEHDHTPDLTQVKLRTKALATTLFARVFLGDLFVHGLGGGMYDQVTDQIIRDFYGIEPPRYVIATGTLRLPIPRSGITAHDIEQHTMRRWAMFHHPETFLDHPSVSPEVRELINQKRHWISITPTKASSAERCRAIRAINVKLGESLAINRQQWIVEHQQLESQLEADQVLGSREYPWPWYPRETLEKFLLAFRSQRP